MASQAQYQQQRLRSKKGGPGRNSNRRYYDNDNDYYCSNSRSSGMLHRMWVVLSAHTCSYNLTHHLKRSLTILLFMLCLVMMWPRRMPDQVYYQEQDDSATTVAATATSTVTTTSLCQLWKTTTTAPTEAEAKSEENTNHSHNNSMFLLNEDCIQQIARVFPFRDESPLHSQHNHHPPSWCIPPSKHPNVFFKYPQRIQQETTESVVGLVFIKNTKAASSTGAGITLRIAEQVGQRVLLPSTSNNNTNTTTNNNNNVFMSLAQRSCVRNWTHAFANYRGHGKLASSMLQQRQQRLLWSIVRQPAKRDVSAFYFFQHARLGINVTDDNNNVWIPYLEAQKSGQFRYLYTEYIADDNAHPTFQSWYQRHSHNMSQILQTLLDTYDFIAVAERWEESLAVMTLLWGLHPQDVIVLSSKTKGGYDDGKFQKQCHKIPSQQYLPPTVSHYLQSTQYVVHNLDVALYAAVQASLDRTIEAVGHERVQERVTVLRQMQQVAETQCQSKAVYPCSANGIPQRTAARQSCYVDDSGCGHDCVDRVLAAHFGKAGG